MGKDRRCSESATLSLPEHEVCVLAGKARQGNSEIREIINEATIEIGKTKERLNIFNPSGLRPVENSLDFSLVHSKPFRRKNITKELDALAIEVAFFWFSE